MNTTNPGLQYGSRFQEYRTSCSKGYYAGYLSALLLFLYDMFSRIIISSFHNFYPSLKH